MNEVFKEIEELKYSRWCEKRDITFTGGVVEMANKLGDIIVSKSPKMIINAIYFHRMTGKKGLEIVVFSDTVISKPIILQSGVILVPCFEVELDGKDMGKPRNQISQYLFNRGRFIYDCWLPMETFEEEYIVRQLEELTFALSTFSILKDCKFTWKLKYELGNSSQYKPSITDSEYRTIEMLVKKIDTLPIKDRKAISRSFGWISRSGNSDDDLMGFLYLMLSIESLCDYIQNECDDDSVLRQYSSEKLTKSQRKLARNSCIRNKHEELYKSNPTKFVQDSYFNCVGSIKRNLESHLQTLFGVNSEEVKDFFGDDNVVGLYKLRSKVAHGSINSMNEHEKLEVISNKERLKKFSLRYIWKILDETFDVIERENTYEGVMSFDMGNLMPLREREPRVMLELYCND